MRYHPLFERYVNCPVGSQYYVCDASDYLGCCKVDACHYDDGCPSGESVVGTTMGAAATTATAAAPTVTATVTTEQSPTLEPTSSSTIPQIASPSSTVPSSTTPKTTAVAPATSSSVAAATSSTPLTSQASTAAPAATSKSATTGTTSNTAGRVSVTTATATATTTVVPVSASHKKGISGGAIGGIVAAVIVLFAVAAGLIFLRMRRRNKALKNADANHGSGERMLTDGNNPASPNPTMSPGTVSSPSPMGEKGGFTSDTPLSNDGSFSSHLRPAEMSGTPIVANAPLFGEMDGTSAAAAHWKPHGRVQGDSIPELDSVVHARAELETPMPTPGSTPMATPQIGSDSPNLSIMSGSQGGRSTLVSSWRSSTRLLGSSTEAISEEQPTRVSLMSSPTLGTGQEQHYVPLVYDARGDVPAQAQPEQPQEQQKQQHEEGEKKGAPGQGPLVQRQASVTESPRPNLDVSQTERVKGLNVASWGAYQG